MMKTAGHDFMYVVEFPLNFANSKSTISFPFRGNDVIIKTKCSHFPTRTSEWEGAPEGGWGGTPRNSR